MCRDSAVSAARGVTLAAAGTTRIRTPSGLFDHSRRDQAFPQSRRIGPPGPKFPEAIGRQFFFIRGVQIIQGTGSAFGISPVREVQHLHLDAPQKKGERFLHERGRGAPRSQVGHVGAGKLGQNILLRRSAGAVLAREQDFRAFTEEGNDKGRNPFDQGRVTRGEYHDAGVPTPVDPFQNLQNDCMHQFRYIHGFTRKYRSVPRAAVERDAQRRDQKRVGGLAHRLARFPGDDRFHSLQTAGAPHQIYG